LEVTSLQARAGQRKIWLLIKIQNKVLNTYTDKYYIVKVSQNGMPYEQHK